MAIIEFSDGFKKFTKNQKNVSIPAATLCEALQKKMVELPDLQGKILTADG